MVTGRTNQQPSFRGGEGSLSCTCPGTGDNKLDASASKHASNVNSSRQPKRVEGRSADWRRRTKTNMPTSASASTSASTSTTSGAHQSSAKSAPHLQMNISCLFLHRSREITRFYPSLAEYGAKLFTFEQRCASLPHILSACPRSR